MVLEDEIVGSVNRSVVVTRKNMEDILTTAFEGGIDYWCSDADYVAGKREQVGFVGFYAPKGFEIILHDAEDGSEFETHLTEATLLKGIQKWIEGSEVHIEDMDAEDADIIVQYAVLGEITFG